MIASAVQTAALFKQVEGGYVFREPYQLGWRHARHYLVNDAQKAELAATLFGPRPLRTRIGLAAAGVVAIAIGALSVSLLSPHRNPEVSDTAAMLIVSALLILALCLVWRASKLKQIAPLLAQLTPTDLQISRTEMQGKVLSAIPTGMLWFCAVVFALLMTSNTFGLVHGLSIGRSIVSLLPKMIQIVAFGGLAIYYALEIAKRMKKHAGIEHAKAG